jgi:predicted metal-dependent TIM-barrel fold hydrolase|tara:strand:+ start:272 stop:1180 length:909 start_codon:yes stop_codon:yes gene_type:complete
MASSAVIPYIDSHCHTHGFPYDAWETIGSTGVAAVVISAGNPHVHREIHDEVPDLNDVRRYWEEPIRFSKSAENMHFFKVFVGVGISFMTRVDQWEQALDLIPELLKKSNVVAIGETGIDPVQYFGMRWPIEEQKIVFEEQVRLAKKLDVPFILHTPTPKKNRDFLHELAVSEIPNEEYKRYFLDFDMEIINKVGLDHKRLVIDHVDETILEYVLEETDAYIGIGVGQTMRHTNPQYFADVVERHGPDRLMVNSDHVAYVGNDLLAIPKTIRELRRRGVKDLNIRKAVFSNANEFYGLNLES